MAKVAGLKRHTIIQVAQREFRKHCRVVRWLALALIGALILLPKSNGELNTSPAHTVLPVMHMHNGNPDTRIGIDYMTTPPTPTGGIPITTQLTRTNFQSDL